MGTLQCNHRVSLHNPQAPQSWLGFLAIFSNSVSDTKSLPSASIRLKWSHNHFSWVLTFIICMWLIAPYTYCHSFFVERILQKCSRPPKKNIATVNLQFLWKILHTNRGNFIHMHGMVCYWWRTGLSKIGYVVVRRSRFYFRLVLFNSQLMIK